jgi:hypothetical protein
MLTGDSTTSRKMNRNDVFSLPHRSRFGDALFARSERIDEELRDGFQ